MLESEILKNLKRNLHLYPETFILISDGFARDLPNSSQKLSMFCDIHFDSVRFVFSPLCPKFVDYIKIS
jgi:hypothetical protein